MRAGPAAPAGPALEDVLTPDSLLPLLQSPDMLSRLAPHMPAEQRCAVCTRPFLMLASSESSRHSLSEPCCTHTLLEILTRLWMPNWQVV